MRFACLGSGSAGNGLLVEAGRTRVLLDCGFPLREAQVRLARLKVDPGELDALLVTHEHEDHAGGVARLAARHGIPVYLTHGTRRALKPALLPSTDVHLIDGHTPFAVGDLEIHPFPVPHDAREPVQFVFTDGAVRLGVLTDTGSPTPHIPAMLNGCHGLVLECNHEPEMLEKGPYPSPLKRRVAGRYGHLANPAAAALLESLDTGPLQHLVAAHLSQTNNTPELARRALAQALSCEPQWIGVADQTSGFDWRQIR